MKHLLISVFLSVIFLLPHPGRSQTEFTMQIVIDKPVDAGLATCFPGVTESEKHNYWYIPKQPKVATGENGKPKMSFIKWVYNEKNGEAEGLGGGIFHLVVGYELDTEELREVERELRRADPRGKLIGPVIFKEGTVNIEVPKINDPEQTSIVAVAPAPVISGSFVAANMQLDKRSASLLWEAFQNTANAPVAINFNMTLAGYNSPMSCKITIKREQIYNHQRMQAGVATPWLAAEVGDFLDEMRESGAIKIEQIGANFQMQEAINRAIDKAQEEFFTPLGSSEGPNLSQLAGLGNQESSFMDKATNLLNSARQEQRQENESIRSRNRAEQDRVDRANSQIREDNRAERDRVNAQNRSNSDSDDGNSEEEDQNQSDESGGEDADGNESGGSESVEAPEDGLSPEDEAGEVRISEPILAEEQEADLEETSSLPPIAITASFVRKRVINKTDKVIDFRESHPTTISWPMGGNVGVTARDCPDCFLEVNLNDQVFKQRNLVATLDGLNGSDFTKFINYGTVQIRKLRDPSENTYTYDDEIRITKANFEEGGNFFDLMYGWNKDAENTEWFDYEYKQSWSFFGNHAYETDWTSTQENTINLNPPLQRRVLDIEAERELLEDRNVRAADVKVYYSLGGEDMQVARYSLRTRDEVLNGQVEIMLPPDSDGYEYEITWRQYGGNEISSGRRQSDSDTIFADEIP